METLLLNLGIGGSHSIHHIFLNESTKKFEKVAITNKLIIQLVVKQGMKELFEASEVLSIITNMKR